MNTKNTQNKNKMSYLIRLSICLLTLSVGNYALAQTTIISHATIHIGDGKVIEDGVLVIEKDRLVEVGSSLKNLYKNAKAIDATGKHIYPGLIAMNNIMGLNEIDAVRATRDYQEQGAFNPNIRSQIAYHTDSKILPTAVYNGVLYTQAVPQGGVISGSSSALKTKAWNWEDATIAKDDGIHLNWPQVSLNNPKHEEILGSAIKEIETFFANASQYQQQSKPIFNARFSAMKDVLSGKVNLYIHAQDAHSIVRSILFFKQNYPAISLVLVGASDAYLLLDFLKTHQVTVVLGNIHRLPSRNAEAIDQPYITPAQLVQAGIKVAISLEGSWEARNLAYIAGTAAAYGLGKEEALKAISLVPAQIMGVSKEIGSLEVGKKASLLIAEGDILDMKSSKLWKAFLDGEELDLKNEQVKLAEKYLEKYKKK